MEQTPKQRPVIAQLRNLSIIAFVFVVVAGFLGCVFANLITQDVKEKQKHLQEEIDYLMKKQGQQELSSPIDETTGNLYHKDDYNKVTNFIKKHEGFVDTPYYCPGGKLTIGYGHVIKAEDNYTKITKEEAHKILEGDLNRAISVVLNRTKLKGKKLLAMAHFVFAKGSGTFDRSGLKDAINTGAAIDSIVMGFCYYRTSDSVIVTNDRMKSIRKWELNLYHSRL